MKIKLLITFLLIAMISCERKEDKLLEKIDTYPLEVGNEWTYNRKVILTEYESETSDNITDIDTTNYTILVSVVKDTILNDTMLVKKITRQESENDNVLIVLEEYLYFDSEGLKQYGSLSEGFDHIYIHEKPLLKIKLPLYENSKWTSVYPTTLLPDYQVDKEVIGCEALNLNGNVYLCFKVRTLSETWDDMQTTDWISKEGLIKTQTIYDRRTLTMYPDIQMYVQITETIMLTDLKLN